MWAAHLVVLVRGDDLECGRFGEDAGTRACGERAETAMGVFLVVALLLLACSWAAWRFWVRRSTRARSTGDTGDPDRPQTGTD